MSLGSSINKYTIILCIGLLVSSQVSVAANHSNMDSVLTIECAVRLSLENEPGISSQDWKVRSLAEKAISESQLPDPKLKIGYLNLPTDTYDLDQENMTQFKIGITQSFPAGDVLDIKQKKIEKQSLAMREKQEQRKLMIIRNVRLTYLEIYYLEQSRKTINENKKLFSQLTNIVRSLFTLGKNNQQDLIRTQLELTQLDDRIVKIDQKINGLRYKLARWIGVESSKLPLYEKLPLWNSVEKYDSNSQQKDFVDQLINHPIIKESDQKIEINRQDMAIIIESYKPDWGVDVSYSYREDRPDGIERADLISIGASIDLPIFSAKRQDKKLLSEKYNFQSLKDERVELLRELISSLQQEYSNKSQLEKRYELYQSLLLPQAKQQAEAALLAYQSKRADFSDVMRAYIDDLNARLDNMRIRIDLLKAKSKILYYLPSLSAEV